MTALGLISAKTSALVKLPLQTVWHYWLKEELALRGLQVKPGKYASLYAKVSNSKCGRTWYVPPGPCLKIKSEEIPHMGITETYCYIGMALGPEPSREMKQLETTSIQTLTDG